MLGRSNPSCTASSIGPLSTMPSRYVVGEAANTIAQANKLRRLHDGLKLPGHQSNLMTVSLRELRMKAIFIPSALILLSGCVGTNAQNFQTSLERSVASEEQAIASADKEVGAKCAKGKSPEKITRNQYVKFNQCATEIFERNVLPVTQHPQLFTKFRAQSLETAQQYQDGKISYAQLQARGKIAWVDYLEARQAKDRAVLQHLDMIDANERESFQRAMQSMPQTVHTRCTTYDGTYASSTSCTTR